jgi:hypothetical protein
MNCPSFLSIDFPPELVIKLNALLGEDQSHTLLDKFLLFQVSRCGLYNWELIKRNLDKDMILGDNPVFRTKSETWLKGRYFYVLNLYSQLYEIPVAKLTVSICVEPYDFKSNFKRTLESSPSLTKEDSRPLLTPRASDHIMHG